MCTLHMSLQPARAACTQRVLSHVHLAYEPAAGPGPLPRTWGTPQHATGK